MRKGLPRLVREDHAVGGGKASVEPGLLGEHPWRDWAKVLRGGGATR